LDGALLVFPPSLLLSIHIYLVVEWKEKNALPIFKKYKQQQRKPTSSDDWLEKQTFGSKHVAIQETYHCFVSSILFPTVEQCYE